MNLHWLASYPKSGNTWVRMLVQHYAADPPEIEARHSDVARYWFQAASPIPVDELVLAEQAQVRGAALMHLQCFLNRPTLVKTHHACTMVNGVPLFTSQWTGKVVYIARDPRDIVASFQNHMDLDSRDDAIEMMGRKGACITMEKTMQHVTSDWSFHVKSWLTNKIDEPLVVRYEDLHKDAGDQLARILTHLGLEPDPERVERAVELCRFERLKGREQEAPFPERSPHATEGFFRRGEVGGHRDELTREQIQAVEERHGEMMDELGYERAAPVRALA